MDRDALFTFIVDGLPDDSFHVVSFKGTEGVSRLFEFQVTLVSRRDDIDIDQTASGKARLTVRRTPNDVTVHGMLARLEQTRLVDGYAFYQALLVPRLWNLTLTSQNQIFLDKTAPGFLSETLRETGALGLADFEFRLAREYAVREYVCQYNESHFAFFCRWLEREGMYFYFEHTEQGEKLVIADDRMAHEKAPGFPPVRFLDVRGGDVPHRMEACSEFIYEQNKLPEKVRVRDYNYRTPSLDLEGQSFVDQSGSGEIYVYGDNFKTPKEAKRQAFIRSEAAACLKKRYKGRSSAAYIRPGMPFTLQGHYRQADNADYLPLLVKHEGSQTAYLLAGLGRCLSDQAAKDFYGNVFLAISSSVQYRHPCQTPWPRFHGAVTARIDGEGSGQYAEVDPEGRYKVRLPFDISGRQDGKASSWIRMAEPYGGDGHGMHFPLHKGTEVLLTFINGDVDRPIISAALPNFEHRSVVRHDNHPANILRSARGNVLVMGDKEGQEFIGLASPFHKSGMALGSVKPGGGGSITLATEGDFDTFTLGAYNEGIVGAVNKLSIGASVSAGAGLKAEISGGMGFQCNLGTKIEYTYGSSIAFGDAVDKINTDMRQTGLNSITLSAGVAQPVTDLANRAKTALGAGMTGTLLASAGVVTACRPNWESMSQGMEEDQAGFYAAGSAVGALGLGLASWGCHKTRELATQISNMKNSRCASAMSLDNSGVVVAVNSQVRPDATFKVAVGNIPDDIHALASADNRSLITVSKGGENIELINKGFTKIKMEQGKSIYLISSHAGKASSMLLSDGNITLRFEGLLKDGDNLLRINKRTGVIELGD